MRVVSEKQLQALAKARAARKEKIAAERAEKLYQDQLAHSAKAAAVAREVTPLDEQRRSVDAVAWSALDDIESEGRLLRLEYLLQQALDSVGVRRADGSGQMHDRCTLCQERGVHHVTPMLCDCWCHKAREVLGGVARAA